MIRRYIRKCKNCFPVYGKEERKFIKRLKQELDKYMSENTDVTYHQLEEQFGTPIDVIKSYYDSLEDENRLVDRACFSKYFKRIFAMIIIILVSFLVYRSTLIYFSYLDGKDTKIIYEESTIEYENTGISE